MDFESLDFDNHIIIRMALNLLGMKAVALETLPESGFMPSVEQCRDLITLKTSAIVLVTPNNPVSSHLVI